jgi:hypothetical protein
MANAPAPAEPHYGGYTRFELELEVRIAHPRRHQSPFADHNSHSSHSALQILPISITWQRRSC